MTIKYLKTGDPQPPPVEPGKLRLYSMYYCPYAQRVRLVLDTKGIPYEMVDINLMKKPEWYSSINPATKVPALVTGEGEVVVESLDISEYLDKKFPEPALRPSDPGKATRHKKLMESWDEVIGLYIQLIRAGFSETVQQILKTEPSALQPFEDELAKTGETFFGGSRPGMLDYMVWPWAERSEVIPLLFPDVKFPTEKFPKLISWGAAMKQDAGVKKSLLRAEDHAYYTRQFLSGTLDFDKL